jgi:hypothetical protein
MLKGDDTEEIEKDKQYNGKRKTNKKQKHYTETVRIFQLHYWHPSCYPSYKFVTSHNR